MALRSYKITDDDEAGTTNSLLVKDAVEHILRYNAQSGADKVNIINISYGLDSDNAELREVFKKAYDSGVTIIASAGNGANARLVYPAAYDFVISVGAATKNGQIYPSSSYGKIDFMAPGEDIFTIDGNNGYIALEGGTSYAAAYITGLAALITEAYLAKTGRRPTPAEVYGTLAKISLKMPNVQAQRQGHGMPDASKITGVI
jgi:subtilisin family serine protease